MGRKNKFQHHRISTKEEKIVLNNGKSRTILCHYIDMTGPIDNTVQSQCPQDDPLSIDISNQVKINMTPSE